VVSTAEGAAAANGLGGLQADWRGKLQREFGVSWTSMRNYLL